jgi:hypothetical protein
MIDTTTPRMTKRVKTFKPKQGLSKAQVQSLVALLKTELESLEWSIRHHKYIADGWKQVNKGNAELYFKRADKARKQRNKLAVIQHSLKRGLV